MQNKEKIRLGRDIDSDIRIADIAVSRCHATILFQENKFQITDNASKFGTLILLKNPILMDSRSNNFVIQVGKMTIQIELKRHWSFMGCICNKNKMDEQDMSLPTFFNNLKVNY